jgi:hypothetical protein|nr:MAG TPA: hypothetical protein [Caudoviricetes sp.]
MTELTENIETHETLETKEYLKFQIYPIYNAEKDELRDAMVVDIAQNGIFVLDPANNVITNYSEDGYPDWTYYNLKDRLLHKEPERLDFVSVPYDTWYWNDRKPFDLVKLRDGRIAVISRVLENAEYRYDGFIITPSEYLSCTWRKDGFAYANIPTNNDIVEIFVKKSNITYN